jgi:hypothetical protein
MGIVQKIFGAGDKGQCKPGALEANVIPALLFH